MFEAKLRRARHFQFPTIMSHAPFTNYIRYYKAMLNCKKFNVLLKPETLLQRMEWSIWERSTEDRGRRAARRTGGGNFTVHKFSRIQAIRPVVGLYCLWTASCHCSDCGPIEVPAAPVWPCPVRTRNIKKRKTLGSICYTDCVWRRNCAPDDIELYLNISDSC